MDSLTFPHDHACGGLDRFPDSNVTRELTKEAVYLDEPYSEQQREGFMKQFRVFY